MTQPLALFVWEVGFGGADILVGLVHILDGDDGQVLVVSEITQRDAGAGLHPKLVDGLLGHVEGNRYAEEHAVGKTVFLDDAVSEGQLANCEAETGVN